MDDSEANEIPVAAARILGLEIPNECRAGVQASLDLLELHASILRRYVASLDASSQAELDRCDGAL